MSREDDPEVTRRDMHSGAPTARFSLLTLVLMYLSFYMTFHYPLLVDTSQWFFWTSAFPVFLLGALTYLACRSALGIGPAALRR